jgi:ABC-type multidrug transport system ATPase subunit
MLSISKIDFAYMAPHTPVLRQWSAEFPGGVSVVSGDDGCGKTTLLKLLAGALTPQAGHLQRLGQPWRPVADSADVFWVHPRTTRYDALTPLACFAHMARRFPHWDTGVQTDVAQALGLQAHAHKTLHMLSAGSRRKVWITAALACGAPLALLDEPLAALDASSIRVLLDILDDCRAHPSRQWILADHTVAPGLRPDLVVELVRPGMA